jgi:hypothetical protein
VQVDEAPDGHLKFHAASVANGAMNKLLTFWQRSSRPVLAKPQGTSDGGLTTEPTLQEEGVTQVDESLELGSLDAQPGVRASEVFEPPVLSLALVEDVTHMVWANLDEPLAQTLRQVGGWVGRSVGGAACVGCQL